MSFLFTILCTVSGLTAILGIATVMVTTTIIVIVVLGGLDAHQGTDHRVVPRCTDTGRGGYPDSTEG